MGHDAGTSFPGKVVRLARAVERSRKSPCEDGLTIQRVLFPNNLCRGGERFRSVQEAVESGGP